MNGKSWCVIGLVAVFLATSILIAEFMLPWIVIVGMLAYTILGYGVIEYVQKEEELKWFTEIEAYEQALETYKNALNNSKSETLALVQKNKDLKQEFKNISKELAQLHKNYKELYDKYGELDIIRELNLQQDDKKCNRKQKKVE